MATRHKGFIKCLSDICISYQHIATKDALSEVLFPNTIISGIFDDVVVYLGAIMD